MIITIKTVTEESGDYGEYRKVEGIDGNGKPVTKNVGDRFSDKWPLLRENTTVEFKMVQKNNKWVINDILTAPELPGPTTPVTPPPQIDEPIEYELGQIPPPPKVINPQERGMWWKELGEMLRAGRLKTDTAQGKAFYFAYYNEMCRVLNLKIEVEKPE